MCVCVCVCVLEKRGRVYKKSLLRRANSRLIQCISSPLQARTQSLEATVYTRTIVFHMAIMMCIKKKQVVSPFKAIYCNFTNPKFSLNSEQLLFPSYLDLVRVY